jgi:hypothetical protein
MKMSTDRKEWEGKIKAILYYKGREKAEESGKVNYIRPVKHLSCSEDGWEMRKLINNEGRSCS